MITRIKYHSSTVFMRNDTKQHCAMPVDRFQQIGLEKTNLLSGWIFCMRKKDSRFLVGKIFRFESNQACSMQNHGDEKYDCRIRFCLHRKNTHHYVRRCTHTINLLRAIYPTESQSLIKTDC